MFSRSPEKVSELTLAVRELREELCAIREVLTELVEATEWQNNNAEDYPALVRDRSAIWSIVEMKLPKLLDELCGSPLPPLPATSEIERRPQQDLF